MLPLENGVEAADTLAEVLGEAVVLDGLCGILAWKEAPGHIVHAGVDPFVRFSERDNRNSERTARLKAAFDRADGVSAEIPDDIRVAQWSKFLFICALSGIGAITRAPIGVTRQLPETRQLIEAILVEIEAVARAQGWPSPTMPPSAPCASSMQCRPKAPPRCSATSWPASHRSWNPRTVPWFG